jgi:beta-glucosidase
MKTRSTTFPKNFAWGAATSALQIEGAPTAESSSPSIWDASVLRTGQVERDESPERACDHHRLPEDIKILRDLGPRHYRFSINWNHIIPEGGSTVNSRGLGFYKHLCDAFHAADITAWATQKRTLKLSAAVFTRFDRRKPLIY